MMSTPVILVLGMAGSGKTTFVKALSTYLNKIEKSSYIINTDPAVVKLPYEPNIDIRTTVVYKDVMRHYKLGPNGAILTSLNLFCTKFGEVIKILEERKNNFSYTIVDTPGQIEVFTWSASGMVISETLSRSFPSLIVYLIDTPRNHHPCTFISNMLNALSIMFKTRLPLIIAFTKTDLASCDDILNWMTDFEAMEEAFRKNPSYSSSFANSLCLSLEDLYKDLKTANISSITLDGFENLINLIDISISETSNITNLLDSSLTDPILEPKIPNLNSISGQGDEICFFPKINTDES